MGLFDFLKKGEEKPQAQQPKPQPQQPKPQAAPAQPTAQQPAQPASAAQPKSGPRFEMYTIKEGDWLSKIAGAYYGDVHKWSKIYDANRDVISDPDKIKAGMVIKIPLE
jgi:nucleoid-associated protein YgaU